MRRATCASCATATKHRFRRLIDALDFAPGTDRTLLRLMLLGALNTTQTWHKRGRRSRRSPRRHSRSQFVATLRHGAADSQE